MSHPAPSFIPYELVLGWRYTRAGRATRRNGFISFISGVSMLGISLGVAALIIVLSVMNGFQKEVRDRMLGVVSHIEVYAPDGGALPDAAATLARALKHPDVVASAPFVAAQALIARGEDMKGAVVRGIDPALDGAVTDLSLQLSPAVREQLQAGRFGVVLGSELARSLGVRVGEPVTVIAPGGQITPKRPACSCSRTAGLSCRLRSVTAPSSAGSMPRTTAPFMSSPRAIKA